MRSQRLIASALAAVFLAASGTAFAGPGDHGPHGPGHGPHGKHHPKGKKHHHPGGWPPPPPGYVYAPAYVAGPGPAPHFHRGGRLPPEYRGYHYVVNDWHGHHLAPPPRGYHWVQAGGDYLLVAIATGIIAQVLLNR